MVFFSISRMPWLSGTVSLENARFARHNWEKKKENIKETGLQVENHPFGFGAREKSTNAYRFQLGSDQLHCPTSGGL